MDSSLPSLHDIDFEIANSPIKIILLKDVEEFPFLKDRFGSLRAGQETEIPFWVAEELVKAGIAKFREEDLLTLSALSKIHWRETLPSSRQIPALPRIFFFLLRRFLRNLRNESRNDSLKSRDLEKAESLSQDIVNCRVRKIVSLAAGPAISDDLLRSLTEEERVLYTHIGSLISRWKSEVVGMEDVT
jgi:hypothetical protein